MKDDSPIEPKGVKHPQDFDTPFSAPSGQVDKTSADYPAADDPPDSTQWYNEDRDGSIEL